MQIESKGNAAVIRLENGEGFYFKKSILTGYAHFDWCFWPPFALGGPILRILNHSYFGMRQVRCFGPDVEIPVTGYHFRGNFHGLTIPAGEKRFVSARHLVGFSRSTKGIRTHIKIHPVYWCLREHFFTVVHGPSTVLLYSPSAFVERKDLVFETPRVVSFDIRRRLTATTVQPRTLYSLFRNIFDRTIYLKFLDEGVTLAEAHHEGASSRFSFREFVLHLLSLLKL
jgi:hypothetical protein